jgi:hypothetical protein
MLCVLFRGELIDYFVELAACFSSLHFEASARALFYSYNDEARFSFVHVNKSYHGVYAIYAFIHRLGRYALAYVLEEVK